MEGGMDRCGMPRQGKDRSMDARMEEWTVECMDRGGMDQSVNGGSMDARREGKIDGSTDGGIDWWIGEGSYYWCFGSTRCFPLPSFSLFHDQCLLHFLVSVFDIRTIQITISFSAFSSRYKKPGKTGMSIIDVGLLTGYQVDVNSVKEVNA